eukprot:SAG31_NODE_45919_length_256_cov_1.700637_1_plen_23_part_01
MAVPRSKFSSYPGSILNLVGIVS